MRKSKRRPIITFLSDFGKDDNFVGCVKGIILGINPYVEIVDITHSIKNHDIMSAAYQMFNTYRFFPKGTIHLAIVDPGVGSLRQPLIIQSENYWFVGPDSGVLVPSVYEDGLKKVIRIENKRYLQPDMSTTFHGRDVFAPVVAWMSKDVPADDFGPRTEIKNKYRLPVPVVRKNLVIGEIIHIDRYGNVITNIQKKSFDKYFKKKKFRILAGKYTVRKILKSYSDGEGRELFGIWGSFGCLELAANMLSAAELAALKESDKIRIEKG